MRKLMIMVLMMTTAMPYTADDFFITLHSNYADMEHGTAVFEVRNPYNKDITLNGSLLNYYIRWNNTPMLNNSIYILKDFNYTCKTNITTIGTGENETEVGWNYTTCVGQRYEPFGVETFTKRTNYMIAIQSFWEQKADFYADWVPIFCYDGICYEKPAWETWAGTELLYEEFTTANNGWTGWGVVSEEWNLTNGAGPWYNDTDMSAAQAYDTDGPPYAMLNKSVNLYGWKDINISFWANTTGNDAGEGLMVYFWNGFTWTKVFTQQANTADWNYTSLILDAQDIADFKISFQCVNNLNSEFCQLDTVRITGWLQNSNWTLTNISFITDKVKPVAIGDADNDGLNEIVVGSNNATNTLRIYKNNTGTWVVTNVRNVSTSINSVAIGDANNDGKNEIVIYLSYIASQSMARIYKNVSGTWIEENISGQDPNSGNEVVIGDFDNDDLNEVALCGGASGGFLNITKNVSGTWVIQYQKSGLGTSTINCAAGDANNDGKTELIIGIEYGGSRKVRMYENKSGGWVETNISSLNVDTEYVNSVAIGDANNDGKNEIVVGMRLANQTRMYENKSGGWVETNISDSNKVSVVKIGDANNDGANEIVIGMSSGTNELRMYNYTGGNWKETNITSFSYGVFDLTIGNITNNDRNHIVVSINSPFNSGILRAFNTSIPSGEAPPATYAFTITVPGNNYSNSSATPWGGGNPELNFTYNKTWGDNQYYVNGSFNYSGNTYWQNSATPAFKFTNLGGTALTWTIAMNHSLPDWVKLFANDTNAVPLTQAFVFSDSNSLALSVAASGTKSLWVYANFTGMATYGGYLNYTQLNHSSS